MRVPRHPAAAPRASVLALVERGLASAVSGAILPTIDPFLYSLSFTVTDGVPLEAVEETALAEIERVRTDGVSVADVQRAKRQLTARLVFETDSVTNIAHQLGYFATVGGVGLFSRLQACIDAVAADEVSEVARRRLAPTSGPWGRSALRLAPLAQDQPLETRR